MAVDLEWSSDDQVRRKMEASRVAMIQSLLSNCKCP